MERDGADRPHVGIQLEESPVHLERPGQVSRLVGRPEAAPGNEIGVRCDRGSRVDLQQGQTVDEVDQPRRPGGVEQLGPNGELPRLVALEPSNPHVPRLVGGTDVRRLVVGSALPQGSSLGALSTKTWPCRRQPCTRP